MHNYNVAQHPKTKIIFYLVLISGTVLAVANQFLDFVRNLIGKPLPFTFSLGMIFAVLYFLFSQFFWKSKLFCNVFKYPNLNGKYKIEGESTKKITGENFKWQGELSIEQNWDKILISMKSSNSTSESMSVDGSVEYLPTRGYRLKYSYENSPNNDQPELHKHVGHCELIFDKELEKGNGNYYNDGKDRQTYGTIILRRI